MGDEGMPKHTPRTAGDIKTMQSHLSGPITLEAHLHQEGKTILAGQDLAPQQAELLQVQFLNTTDAVSVRYCLDSVLIQVVQDQWCHSSGRFIATVAMQLRKRAVSLCHQELKEYKVRIENKLQLNVVMLY